MKFITKNYSTLESIYRIVASACMVLVTLVVFSQAVTASVQVMVVDEILFQGNEPANTTLSGAVRMDLVNVSSMWFLQVELTNTTTQNPISDSASNIMTGVGFVLPSGISINSSKGSNTISNLDLDSTASTKVGSGADIANDNWGFGDASSGHFNDPAVFSYDTVLSTFNSDVTGTTLIGTAKDNGSGGNIGQFDYGLKSALAGQGPGPKEPYYQDHLTLNVKLDVPSGFDSAAANQVLADINDGPVGITFGSPAFSNQAVPEPGTLIIWMLLGLCATTIMHRR